MKHPHFLNISDIDSETLMYLLNDAIEIKKSIFSDVLKQKTLGLLFQKPSTRTRISFEVGMKQLGGHVISLQPDEVGLGEREEVKDVARVMSRYVDAVMIRAFDHAHIQEFSHYSSCPVINGLSDLSHPCQALSDALTIIENHNRWSDITLTYVGDGNNVCVSLIEICYRLGWKMIVSCPEGFDPVSSYPFEIHRDVYDAVKQADVVYTDVWTSMGQEKEKNNRKKLFMPFQINELVMKHTKQACVFMHCLPAVRGEEVTDHVIESEQSVVFHQAENRLHAQKSILKYLLTDI
jgi:ornithine carbamoyltransferase